MAILDSADDDDLLIAGHLSMTLLSGTVCVFSHCCRVVLLEKDVEGSIEYVSARDNPERLFEYNPYGETPTLVDRELILYDPAVIIEYLDERFPHPPLMPVDPISRAKTRLIISRLVRDWLEPLSDFEEKGGKPPAELKKNIRDGLLALSPLFAQQPYFMSEEYTLADAYFTPLLWRLPWLGIALPKQANAVRAYAERMFTRPAFTGSLSRQEAGLR
ncbi:MAG: glutathione S-transferase N-terminal domain-containing protein [Gammaproteobacteria bacterium]|nr:glutathione S-transferase N-terminal domain-containing protein [Gammaproteobacteria bacterium]CAJ2376356.1 MAG: stringent starvation protein A [Arenicellales bacterium IbO2]MDA7961172.1 glutathione S-transferase N-terminal domain-containing protein [Gammaproteobacteria bacterium]MDA7970528.1 glutathione S-transferase N-terminal domain-containing protein [Gammaproteobacteria bacterium]MDA7972152.1 glutathione S-transferase N-terminal domain-containing protein [Gammaproteobacteria bacterium]